MSRPPHQSPISAQPTFTTSTSSPAHGGNLPTWLEAIATFGLVVFAFLQVEFVRRTTSATEAMLHLNRPAIVITFIDSMIGIHQPSGRPDTLIGYSPHIYNLGSGPAEIIEAFTHTQVFDSFDEKNDIPCTPAEEPCVTDMIWDARSARMEFPRRILGPNESFANYVDCNYPVANWIKGDIEAVEIGQRRRAIYGIIRYRSSVKEYWTRFFYWWDPRRRSFRQAERPELNQGE